VPPNIKKEMFGGEKTFVVQRAGVEVTVDFAAPRKSCPSAGMTSDGVGVEATNDFRRGRFSRSAKGAPGLSKPSPLKTRVKRS
jgi:hypothetical protein